MPGRVVVQWDKDDCADLGIIKVDLLGLGMMAVLEEAIPLVRAHEGIELDLAHLPPDDPTVYGACCSRRTPSASSRSRAARRWRLLPRMKPRALLRSGRRGGDHPSGADRRADGAPVSQPPRRSRAGDLCPPAARADPAAHARRAAVPGAAAAHGHGARRISAGGEAEELRRAMGFKRSVERMRADRAAAARRHGGSAASPARPRTRSCTAITSFALYGFPESHAASFALIAYASAYLRAHHPAAFTCAMLNNWPMGFYHPATLVKDAQRHGVEVLPIDVTRSDWRCNPRRRRGAARIALRARPAR